jgi:hypothetical protein
VAHLSLDEPEEEKSLLTSIRLPRKKLKWLDDIAKRETAERRKRGEKRVLSRNDIIEKFLDWAMAQYWEERGNPTERQDAKIRK